MRPRSAQIATNAKGGYIVIQGRREFGEGLHDGQNIHRQDEIEQRNLFYKHAVLRLREIVVAVGDAHQHSHLAPKRAQIFGSLPRVAFANWRRELNEWLLK